MSADARKRKTMTLTELFGPKVLDQVPEGYHTAKEIAQEWSMSEVTARRALDSPDVEFVMVHTGSTPAKAYRVELE